MNNKFKKAFYILHFTFLIFLIFSCTKPEPTNPFDPEVDIYVSNLQYEKLAINQIKLTWENEFTIDTRIIRIDKKVGTASWQESIAELASDVTTWTDNDAEINEILQYRVYAFCGDNSSNYIETGVIDNTIPTPENLDYTINLTCEITLHWDYNITGIEGFKINKNGTLLTEVIPAGTTEWTDVGINIEDIITYQVLAFYQSYTSAYSNEVTWEIPAGMIFVQGGTFEMGDHYGEGSSYELPAHDVTIDAFFIGDNEVTQGEYEAVVGSNPAHNYGVGANYPVYYLSWYDAVTFCNLKSQQEGLMPCYNLSNWSCDFNANGYRLPTEAEWEYAARGGVNWTDDYRYSGCHNVSDLPNYAWISSNSNNQTHPVGTKLPNQLEIHDMSGNVWEWCNDWYDSSYYSSSPANNPTGPPTGTSLVLRGGSWRVNGNGCRVANRDYGNPYYSYYSNGFRFTRTP